MISAEGVLVSKLQALLHAGDLRIAASLPDAAVLARGLHDFRVRFAEASNATLNDREGAHDDLVVAWRWRCLAYPTQSPVDAVRVQRAR